MIRDDDDHLDPGPVPDPDAEPTPAEKAKARAFGELVDKVVAGRSPAAMSAEDRALVEVATVIRAAEGLIDLAPQRKSALIESALRRAIDKPRGHETVPPTVSDETPEPAEALASNVTPLAPRRWKQRAPWLVAAASSLVAAAAIVALMMRPAKVEQAPAPAPVAELPDEQRSRPADALIGIIPPERAGDASIRVDAIFADRLDGYRELAMGGR
jgi:hypothetical protein